MEVKLTAEAPNYRHRLKSGINHWCIAAIVGLFGTWTAGTTVQTAGNLMDYELNIVVTPMTAIISVVWLGIVIWWYKERSSLTSKYRAAAAKSPDEFYLDDFGVTWGVPSVTSTKIAWAAVAFYRLTSSRLELGLPAGVIEVPLDELDQEVDLKELDGFIRSKAVRKAG